LTGSISQGRNAKYRYYHCATVKCKGRFSAEVLDKAYEDQLKRIQLSPGIAELLEMVLQGENIASSHKEYHSERRTIMTNIELNEAFRYITSLKPPDKAPADYSGLNDDHLKMANEVDAICQQSN
jgi:hypothetical protein